MVTLEIQEAHLRVALLAPEEVAVAVAVAANTATATAQLVRGTRAVLAVGHALAVRPMGMVGGRAHTETLVLPEIRVPLEIQEILVTQATLPLQ